MEDLLLFRERYGSVFVTNLSDGQKIPYRLLSVGEFLEYERLFKSGQYPRAYLENEIFLKCVADPLLIDHIGQLNAGVITTVSTAIMAYSGPGNVSDLNGVLDVKRHVAGYALHEMVGVICQAFPAYKPEELYDMPFDTFMLRVAQAERKLLKAGIFQEPISFEGPEGQTEQKRDMPPVEELQKRWKEQQQTIPQPRSENVTITKSDIIEHEAAYTGHEIEDKVVLEHQMVEETKGLYANYLEQMRAGKKVEITSHEERKAAALARARQNEELYKKALARKQVRDKAERERLLKIREEMRAARRRKKRR
jgi:hypothetical protein